VKTPLGTQQRIPDDLAAYSSGSWSHYEGLTWCYVVDTIGTRLSFNLFLWNTATEQKALLASFDDKDGTILARIVDAGDGAPELIAEEIMRTCLAKTRRPPNYVREEMCARLADWIRYWRSRTAQSRP
jgi:hypothetical protein